MLLLFYNSMLFLCFYMAIRIFSISVYSNSGMIRYGNSLSVSFLDNLDKK